MTETTDIGRLRRLLTKNAAGQTKLTSDEIAYLQSIFEEDSGYLPAFLYELQWRWSPEIEHAETGSNADWRGGAVKEPGWYVHPLCYAGCCRPDGPFDTKEGALLTHRREMMRDTIRDDIELSVEKLIDPEKTDDTADGLP